MNPLKKYAVSLCALIMGVFYASAAVVNPAPPLYTQLLSTTIAANAGATAVLSIPIPANDVRLARVKVIASSGSYSPITCASTTNVSATGDFFTNTATTLPNGVPVTITNQIGGAIPGGTALNTVYFARSNSVNSISIYDTQAHAVAGGATGLIDITSTGTNAVVMPSTLNAVYLIDAVGKQVNNIATLIGSTTVTAKEDVAAWDASIVINNTKKSLDVQCTPDAVIPTIFRIDAEVFTYGRQE